MARTLSLVRRDDFSADIESLSLIDYTNGFQVENGGWEQTIAGDEDESVIETMTLFVNGTGHNSMAANVTALDKLLAKAKWYKETQERYALWLRTQLTNESHPRDAVILSAERGKVNVMSKPASPGNRIHGYPLSLERTPMWEGTAVTVQGAAAVSGVGGYTDDIATTVGTDPARIAFLTFAGDGVATTEYWFGWRTSRNGTLGNFVAPWELELGTAGTDTALATDATASPGGGGNTKLNCTFTTATAMTLRVTLTPYQIDNETANYTALRGTFDLILRAKCSDGETARVQLSCGLGASFWTCDPVTVTGTTWKFYNIGRVTLPAAGKGQTSSNISAMRNTTMRISAELTAGSAGADALDLDCVVPIPVDEGFGHICGTNGVLTGIQISPTGVAYAFEESSSIPSAIVTADLDPRTCVVPVGANRMYIAAQRAAGSTLADTVLVSSAAGSIIPRWRTLRGDDS